MSARYVISRDHAGRYHFVLKAANGETLLSSEYYNSHSGVLNGLQSVRYNGEINSRYVIRNSPDGAYYFTLKASNGMALGVSERYRSRDALDRAIERIKILVPTTVIQDAT